MQVQQIKQDSLFCSISLMTSGSILSLSTWSRSTLDHFCSESMMIQGRDISTTNTAKQSVTDWAETANLSRPLWYRSPSRIHTLQRVRSTQDKWSTLLIKNTHTEKDKRCSTHHLCLHHGHLSTGTPVPFLSYCVQRLQVWPWVLFCLIHPPLQNTIVFNCNVTLFSNESTHGMAKCITLNLNTANALATLWQTTWLIKF